MDASVVAVLVLALVVSACAGSGESSRGERVGATEPPDTTISIGLDGAWSVVAKPADRLVRDAQGAYFCVLRRPDDLADLRAQFNKRQGE